jgi:hypothetical protein
MQTVLGLSATIGLLVVLFLAFRRSGKIKPSGRENSMEDAKALNNDNIQHHL